METDFPFLRKITVNTTFSAVSVELDFLTRFPKTIRSLFLTVSDFQFFPLISTHFESCLTCLHLIVETLHESLIPTISQCHHLQHLTLDCHNECRVNIRQLPLSVLKRLNNFKHFLLQGIDLLDGEQFAGETSQLKQLRFLHLVSCYILSQERIQYIVNECINKRNELHNT
jgi:hypothetical protein